MDASKVNKCMLLYWDTGFCHRKKIQIRNQGRSEQHCSFGRKGIDTNAWSLMYKEINIVALQYLQEIGSKVTTPSLANKIYCSLVP